MDRPEGCGYEIAILAARRGFMWRSALALLWLIGALVLYHFFGKPNLWVSRAGALMSVTAYLADLKAQEMASVLKPSGFVSMTFADTKAKYRGQVKLCRTIAAGLVVLGGLVWGFADLLP